SRPATVGSRLPPWWVWSIFTFFSLIAILAQVCAQRIANWAPLYDGAASNIGSLGFAFFACLTLYFWFIGSRSSPLARLIVGCAPHCAILLACACLRYEGVDGYMKPTFAFRWQPRKETALAQERAIPVVTLATQPTESGIDLETETPADYPQFLGP